MTQPALTNGVNSALGVFRGSLGGLLAEAATQIVVGILQKEAGTLLTVNVPALGTPAVVDPKSGTVTLGGQIVTEVGALLQIAQEVHTMLGMSPPVAGASDAIGAATPPAPEPPPAVSGVAAELAHEFPPTAPVQ